MERGIAVDVFESSEEAASFWLRILQRAPSYTRSRRPPGERFRSCDHTHWVGRRSIAMNTSGLWTTLPCLLLRIGRRLPGVRFQEGGPYDE